MLFLKSKLQAHERARLNVSLAIPPRDRRARPCTSHEGGDVIQVLRERVATFASRPALSVLDGSNWKTMTYRRLACRIEALARRLQHIVVPDDRIAILCEPRPEWAITFFAIARVGAIVVPLDTKLTPGELEGILADAGVRFLFHSKAYAAVASVLKERLPELARVIPIDGRAGQEIATYRVGHVLPPVRLEDTAVIVYIPAGERPQGVMVTFGNLLFQVDRLCAVTDTEPGEVFLSTLPLNHLLEITCGLLAVLSSGGQVCYAHSLHPGDVLTLMRERGVTQVITVPLFLKLMRRFLQQRMRRQSPFQRTLLRMAQAASTLLPSARARRWLLSRVPGGFQDRLPRFRHFVSGAAALDPDVETFFGRLALPIYQGYGLTETSPVISLNTPHHHRAASVGRPLPDTSVRLLKAYPHSDIGEILTRGPHVVRGYYNRPEATQALIDEDGWLHTGDLGRIDSDGFLYIVGRVKELIVLGGGKKVHPQEVEFVLSQATLVQEVYVMGGMFTEGLHAGTEEVCAVIVPRRSSAASEGKAPPSERAIQAEIKALAQQLAPFKRPSRLIVRSEELPRLVSGQVDRARLREQLGAGDGLTAVLKTLDTNKSLEAI